MRARPIDRWAGRERGFILIFVVGMCLMLAAIAIVVTRSIQINLRSLAVTVESTRAQALADGGLRIAAVRLAQEQQGGASPTLASLLKRPTFCQIAGIGGLILEAEVETGKISLNSRNMGLLEAAFQGLGASPDLARRYAQAVFDYRDLDDESQWGGSETEAWSSLAPPGAPVARPSNRDFETVDELDHVTPIPRVMRESLKQLATSHTKASGVDPEWAPAEVLRILNPAGAGGSMDAAGRQADLPLKLIDRTTALAYTIRATAVLESGARFVRVAVVEFSGGTGEKLVTRHWLQGRFRDNEQVEVPYLSSRDPC